MPEQQQVSRKLGQGSKLPAWKRPDQFVGESQEPIIGNKKVQKMGERFVPGQQ